MIIKRRHTGNFAIIPNAVMSDERISLEARGLLGYLLSKPDDWEVNVNDLRRAGKNSRRDGKGLGRNKVYRILNELVGVGYVKREQPRDEAGQMLPMQYEVHDVVQEVLPVEPEDDIEPVPDNGEAVASPRAHSPRPGLPRTVKGDAVLYKDNNKTESNKTVSHKPREREREVLNGSDDKKSISNLFHDFVDGWPKSKRTESWRKAELVWNSLNDDERHAALARRDDFVTANNEAGRQHLVAMSTYLSEKLWKNLGVVEVKPIGPALLGIYGREWMAHRLALLGEVRKPWKPTVMMERMINSSGNASVFDDDRRRGEFPGVTYQDREAEHGRGVRLAAGTQPPESSSFVKVKVGSELWQQWTDWHEAMDYPWINPPKHIEWIWMPADIPEEGLTALQNDDDAYFVEATR